MKYTSCAARERPAKLLIAALACPLAWLLGFSLGCTSESDNLPATPVAVEQSATPATSVPRAEASASSTVPPAPTTTSTPAASLSPSPTLTGRVTLTGLFNVVIGDPRGLEPPARMAASLTDDNGRRWRLIFDQNTYQPSGSLLDFNLKRVNVEGTLTGEPDTVLVTRLALAP